MRPRQTILVLEDLVNSFQGPCFRNGVQLSCKDRGTLVDVYLHWVCILLDLGYLDPGSFRSTAKRLLSDILEKDVMLVNGAFAELLQSVRLQENNCFKGNCRSISAHLHSIVKNDFALVLTGDVHAAKRLVQVFAYTSRLSLVDVDLQDECLDAYRDVERTLCDDLPVDVVRDMNKYVRSWMKAFDPTRLVPSHSNGAVADVPKASLELKYRSLSSDMLVEYAYGDQYLPTDGNQRLVRCSKTIFVPKSYKTFRTISMEPATLQYLQQSVWKEIDRVVGCSYFLRSRIGFHDQTRNQRLAKVGSFVRNYATIDMSSASDSVSYDLVKRVFNGTKLLRFIVATRSKQTLFPDGTGMQLRKFAPMGSSLCFPLMTIIFASVCQIVTLEHGVPGDYSCFGDDLIVPTQCVGSLIALLGKLGFTTNVEKSYFRDQCWFRESCGAEYCNGYDVTPIRISRKYAKEQRTERITALVSLANSAYDRGFHILRSFLLGRIWALEPRVMFGPDALKSVEYSNFHLKSRWNRALQRLECWAYSPCVKYKKADESIRYRHWLESTVNRKAYMIDSNGAYRPMLPPDENCFISIVGRPTVFVHGAWVAKPLHRSDYAMLDAKLPGWRIVLL